MSSRCGPYIYPIMFRLYPFIWYLGHHYKLNIEMPKLKPTVLTRFKILRFHFTVSEDMRNPANIFSVPRLKHQCLSTSSCYVPWVHSQDGEWILLPILSPWHSWPLWFINASIYCLQIIKLLLCPKGKLRKKYILLVN